MRIFEHLFSFMAPFECLDCRGEGRLLCGLCFQKVLEVPSRCYRCLRATNNSETCKICRKVSSICSLYVRAVYGSLAKEFVWRMKYSGAKAAAKEIAERITDLLPSFDNEVVIVPVPTTASRARHRGYDQAKLIAKELSGLTHQPYADFIARSGSAHQVGASRSLRKKQLASVFRVKNSRKVVAKHILLVDDVLTTGSTLEAAARAVRKAGAVRVDAVVFAQAE